MTPFDASSEIAKVATGLLRQRNLGPFTAIEPLSGGRNNRTFRITCPSGSWLLKHYFQDATGLRDRRASEWNWSTFCWQQGMTCIPEPLVTDAKSQASLFEFIDGRHLLRDEVSDDHVKQAAVFVTEVNRHRDHLSALALPSAAEACFSLKEHVTCVDCRIERLTALPTNVAHDTELSDWLRGSLIPAWRSIAALLRTNTTFEQFCKLLPMSYRCLSPSDFGFHNALLTPDGCLRFFDFEYAGWDDPAKLVCDFYWQQQLPAPRHSQQTLLSALATAESASDLASRIETLFPVYKIKWCCLVLNEFIVGDRRRREFAQSKSLAENRRGEQLERAKRLLQSVHPQFP